MNVVSLAESGERGICQKPELASSLLRTVAPRVVLVGPLLAGEDTQSATQRKAIRVFNPQTQEMLQRPLNHCYS